MKEFIANNQFIWIFITATGTAIMAIAVGVTAYIASRTLLFNKKDKTDELSKRLIDKWRKENYTDKYLKLCELPRRISEYERMESEEQINTEIAMIHDYGTEFNEIEHFIYKLNFYLDSGQLRIENIDMDFSEIFGTSDLDLQKFHTILKKSQKKVGLVYRDKRRNVIDIFFLRFAKYKKFNSVIIDIRTGYHDQDPNQNSQN